MRERDDCPLADPTGVVAHRRSALERVQLLLEDWADTQRKLFDTEARMTVVLDELELTELATGIHGLSPVGAAAILAETGNPHRFATARALAKHAGPGTPGEDVRDVHRRDQGRRAGPTEATTGGLTRGLGRAADQHRRRRPLPTHHHPRHHQTHPTQAETVIAAAILRHLHAVITTGTAWDPVTATHGTRRTKETTLAA